ncbi:MFS transporter [Alcaligenaceae bacterium A4P071]|nr:MFS transporter [Alcaligenaceae bacterium A4P071]
MPVAIYVFSLCTFAFGLSEFVVAGLVSAMASDLDASIAAAGTAIAAYAFGAAIGAPFITACLAQWRDKHILILAMAVLAVGSVLMSMSPNLAVLLAVRFVVGLAHGVFMAVASDAATRLVDRQRAGRALSVVWIGLTLALALGVPLGTYLGSMWSWRMVFASVAALGAVSIVGLLYCVPLVPNAQHVKSISVLRRIKAILHPQLLIAAGIAALVSVATFSFFTFVSPYLLHIADVDITWLSVAMLLFGLCAIVGNLLGGALVDKLDARRSIMGALIGLMLTLIGLYAFGEAPIIAMALIGTLGVCFFSIVTMLTLHLLMLAHRYAPDATAIAAGLNIASFNLGTALGGAIGGATIAYGSLAYVPLVGALAAAVALVGMLLHKGVESVAMDAAHSPLPNRR